jgi:hypothetical protein
MNDCPNCEYHKQRAQLWRDEVYRLAGHPLPRKETMIEDDDDIQEYKKPWVGLTEEEIKECFTITPDQYLHWHIYKRIEQKLKERNA